MVQHVSDAKTYFAVAESLRFIAEAETNDRRADATRRVADDCDRVGWRVERAARATPYAPHGAALAPSQHPLQR